jgi:hypothetical protein
MELYQGVLKITEAAVSQGTYPIDDIPKIIQLVYSELCKVLEDMVSDKKNTL